MIMSFRTNPRLYIISWFVAIGGLLCGYQTGVMSSVYNTHAFQSQFIDNHSSNSSSPYRPSDSLVSYLLIGCTVGALIAGRISDYLSRKYSIIVFSIVLIIGAVLQSISVSLLMLHIARAVGGLAVGAFSVLVPLYLSEIAPEKIRGQIVSFHQLGVTIGIDISFWIGYGMSKTFSDDWPWRIPFGLQIAPAIILAVGVYFCPFSPRWLMMQDREEEALAVLQKIRFCSDSEISQELNWMKVELALERARSSQSWSSLIRRPLLRRLILGIGIQIFQQLTGINSTIYSSPDIFKHLNVSDDYRNITSGISGSVNVLITIPAVLLIDRIGRRVVLILGAIVMALSMFTIRGVISSYGYNYTCSHLTSDEASTNPMNFTQTYIIIPVLYIYVAAFAFSWGPAIWIYCTEIFPLTMRARGTSILLATNWATNCVISALVPILLKNICVEINALAGGCCILIGLLTFIFYPETKGVPLERMDELFSRPIHAFRCARDTTNFDDLDDDESTPMLNSYDR